MPIHKAQLNELSFTRHVKPDQETMDLTEAMVQAW